MANGETGLGRQYGVMIACRIDEAAGRARTDQDVEAVVGNPIVPIRMQ